MKTDDCVGHRAKFKCFLDISTHYLSQCDNWPDVTLIRVMTVSCTTVYRPAKVPARNFTNNEVYNRYKKYFLNEQFEREM